RRRAGRDGADRAVDPRRGLRGHRRAAHAPARAAPRVSRGRRPASRSRRVLLRRAEVPDFRTLPEAFQHTATQRPDAVALRTPDHGLSLTWSRYADAVCRIAGGLAGLGLERGATFATM